MTAPSSELKRTLGLPLLVLYGLGTVLGAGIYVLIGEVAGRAGAWAPVSFMIASALSALTALSFAELSGRFPKSAGEAVYVLEGFGRRELSLLVGCLVALAGIVSSAAIAQGFSGYLGTFIDVPHALTGIALICGLTALAIWGIAESVWVAAVLTVVEAGALVVVITLGAPDALTAPAPASAAAGHSLFSIGVLSGAVLAFYAFIGFEDMVNVAEEVHDAPRNMARAIFIVIVVTAAVYIATAFVAVRTVPPEVLAQSDAPLALLFSQITGWSGHVMSAVAIVAVANGALIQIIMAARVIYGLSRQGSLPTALGQVHPRTQTPIVATALVGVVVMGAMLSLPLATLAEITSAFILLVFVLVNLALIAVKRRGPAAAGLWQAPLAIPVLGAASSSVFCVFAVLEVFRA